MNRQKGQSAVELALILPLFFVMVFGMIYGGMMFMDYLSLNNSAYEVSREISLTADKGKQDEIKTAFEKDVADSKKQVTKLYSATPEIKIGTEDVAVEIELNLNENNLPWLLSAINFPPKKLSPIKIVMPLENKFDSQ